MSLPWKNPSKTGFSYYLNFFPEELCICDALSLAYHRNNHVCFKLSHTYLLTVPSPQ